MGNTHRKMAIKVLVLLALAAYQCVAIPTTVTVNDCPAAVPACAKGNANIIVPEAIETLQVHTTAAKFTKMNPAAFISAMTSSGGSETDCRDFATETQTEISTSVTSTQATLDAIDNGDGCAQEGQTEVSTAQDRVDNAQTSLTAAQADVVTKEAAKHVACTADVNLGTMGLNALEMETCFDYTSLADYTTIKAACTSATSALTAANQAVVTAQAELTDAQTAHAAAVTEAARLMSACLCRVHHEQNAAWSAATSETASHAADWKQAHEVICALDQTTTCPVPPCPTVTQPTVAAGVANADAEHCTSTPTTAPTSGGRGLYWSAAQAAQRGDANECCSSYCPRYGGYCGMTVAWSNSACGGGGCGGCAGSCDMACGGGCWGTGRQYCNRFC